MPRPGIDAAWVERVLKDVQQIARLSYPEDRDRALAIVRRSPSHFKFLGPAFGDDPEIADFGLQAMQVIGGSPPPLSWVSRAIREDRQKVLTSVQHWPMSLKFAGAKVKDDSEVVRAAIRGDAQALQFASARLRNDPEIVRDALENGGLALEHASELIRADRDTVLLAVERHPQALKFASPELQSDREFLLRVARLHSRHASGIITADIFNDADFQAAFNSALASPGDGVPIVCGTISEGSGKAMTDRTDWDDGVLHCTATLLSGLTLTFDVSKREATISEFSKQVRTEMRRNKVTVPRHIHLLLTADLDGEEEAHAVTPFEARRPLREFLPSQTQTQTRTLN